MMAKRDRLAGNTATGWLKLIALVFMFCDHAGKMLLPGVPEMRVLGRVAFPLYCWCMVVGFHYTRSVPRYILRVLAVGIISQPLYKLALNHTWKEPNIFLTLALALCALWGVRERKLLSHIWAPALALMAAVLLDCDYGWKGVLLVLLLYGARHSRSALAAVMVAFCLYWGTGSGLVTDFFGIPLNVVPAPFSQLTSPFLRTQAMAILALPLMLCTFPRDVKLPAWVSYGIYPAHLVLLYALEQFF